MAETRKITIEIITKEGSDTTPKPVGVQPENTESKEKASSEGKMLLKSVILNQGYNTAKRLIVQGVEANINNYLALSEDYMAENTYNLVKTTISKATGFTSSIISGATAGSVGGVAGAVVGGIIGGVGYGVSEVIGYQSRMSGYYRALNSSAIEKDYFSRKSGLYDNGKGTEN